MFVPIDADEDAEAGGGRGVAKVLVVHECSGDAHHHDSDKNLVVISLYWRCLWCRAKRRWLSRARQEKRGGGHTCRARKLREMMDSIFAVALLEKANRI